MDGEGSEELVWEGRDMLVDTDRDELVGGDGHRDELVDSGCAGLVTGLGG